MSNLNDFITKEQMIILLDTAKEYAEEKRERFSEMRAQGMSKKEIRNSKEMINDYFVINHLGDAVKCSQSNLYCKFLMSSLRKSMTQNSLNYWYAFIKENIAAEYAEKLIKEIN